MARRHPNCGSLSETSNLSRNFRRRTGDVGSTWCSADSSAFFLVPISVPPLPDCWEDIPALVSHFVRITDECLK